MIQVLANKTDAERVRIKSDTERFLQNGGQVQQVAPGATGTDMRTRVDAKGALRWKSPLELRSPKPEGKR